MHCFFITLIIHYTAELCVYQLWHTHLFAINVMLSILHILIQMHFLRATVLQQALSTPFVSVPRSIPSSNVMLDYCSCHRIEDNVKALTEAIIFATDNRKSVSNSM